MGERGELNRLIKADSKEVVVCVRLIRIFQVKGLVHPKMKILSLITHPHVVSNP